MKNTVTILRERLFSIIRRLVEEPEPVRAEAWSGFYPKTDAGA